MNEVLFWRILRKLDWKHLGDDDAVMRRARDALCELPEADISAFHDLLAEKLHALDTRKHCRYCYKGELDPDNGDDYISADDFLYSRCAVVANGRKFYEHVLRYPSTFPVDKEFESLLSLAADAYQQKTGQPWEHAAPVSVESFSNQRGWRPTKATRPGRFTGPDTPPGNRRPA